jgi:hypothetical protein
MAPLPRKWITRPGYFLSVAIGDLNGDGTPDLAVACEPDNTVSVFLNMGDGTLAPHATYGSA